MMTLSERELDEIIGEKVLEELNNIEVPNIDEQWTKFQRQLQSEETMSIKEFPHNIRSYKKFAWAAVFIIMIGSAVIYKPTYTEAFGGKLIELYNYIVGKTSNNQTESYQHTPSSDMPIVQDHGANAEKEVTREEAQSIISYKLAIPNYLPEGAYEYKIIATTLGSNIQKITIQYLLDAKSIVFEQSNTSRAASRGSLYDTDDTVIKEITINGTPATLFVHKTGLCTLNWEMRGLILQLTGNISSEELIKIASSIT